MQHDTAVFDIHHRLRICRDGFLKSLDKFRLPGPFMTVSGTELLIQIAPPDGGATLEMMQAISQPDIDIQGG